MCVLHCSQAMAVPLDCSGGLGVVRYSQHRAARLTVSGSEHDSGSIAKGK